MSRLDDEFIVAVVRNRSGIDSGCIDYNLHSVRFAALNSSGLLDVIIELDGLIIKCKERILELGPR